MKQTMEPSQQSKTDVLIIGAGITGRTAAQHLERAGLSVRILDKGRGGAGRCATRRRSNLACDHGAQYFTIRDSSHADWLDGAIAAGHVAPWHPRLAVSDGTRLAPRSESSPPRRYVGCPGMSAVGLSLDAELRGSVEFGLRVDTLEVSGSSLQASATRFGSDAPARHAASTVLVTAPPAQAATLLEHVSPTLSRDCGAFEAAPTWAAGFALAEPLAVEYDAVFLNGGPLAGGFACRDSSKPGRETAPGTQEVWVVTAGEAYSREHLEREPERMAPQLFGDLLQSLGVVAAPFVDGFAHRWRYARPASDRTSEQDYLCDWDKGVVWAGDWLCGGRIEGAMLSGRRAAEALIAKRG